MVLKEYDISNQWELSLQRKWPIITGYLWMELISCLPSPDVFPDPALGPSSDGSDMDCTHQRWNICLLIIIILVSTLVLCILHKLTLYLNTKQV